MRILSIPSDKFIEQILPLGIFNSTECTAILLKLRGLPSVLPNSIQCSNFHYGRLSLTKNNLRHVVLNRPSDRTRFVGNSLTSLVLLSNFSVSTPILLGQIQTSDNSTLKYAQMTLKDNDGREVGIARPLGSQWKFENPTVVYANRTYSVIIDKVIMTRAFVAKEFCISNTDVKFKGSSGENYIRISYWLAHGRGC